MRLAALAVLLALPGIARAGVTVAANLGSTALAPGEQTVLSVTITGSATASPAIPPIPDVEVYESGRSSSMMIRNGSVQTSTVYTFVLAPRKAGKYKVPAITVPGAAPTEPIDFEVGAAPAVPAVPRPATGGPGPSAPQARGTPAAFVNAALAKKTAFVNEQVNLSVRFFTAVPLLSRPQYESPKLTGLISEDVGAEGQGTTSIGGRVYNYSELRAALFPVQAGRAAIGPATVLIQLPTAGSTGDDFFDRVFGMQNAETRRLTTDPLTLEVLPLPPGKPDDFSGVVGSLSVEASADKKSVKAGEAVTLTVKVHGSGNLRGLPEPKRPDLPAVRFFDSESSVQMSPAGGVVQGVKTFRTVMVPRVSGPLEIPPFHLSYFDPEKKRYETAKSFPLKLTVLPGDPNAAQPLVSGPGPAPGVTTVSEDVAYLKAPGGRALLSDALAAFGAALPLHSLPVLVFAGALGLDWRKRARLSNPRARRAREALAAAERRLKDAEAASDRAKAVSLLAESLTSYLADKLGVPASGLSLKQASEALPPSVDRARLKTAWEELDLLRFAPQAGDAAEVARIAAELRALYGSVEEAK